MICVYSSDTTTFTNNGLAVLEPTLCELTMTINGAWTLTLEHPYDLDGKYLNLEKGNIIKVTDIGILRGCDTTQRYRIYDSVKGLSSMRVIALPVGMEATYDAIIEELNIKAKTGNQAVALISSYLTNHGVSKYTLTASGLSKKRTTKFKNTNLIAALCGSDDGSIVNKYGAEILYNNYQIFVKSHIGNTTPQYDVRIGKNLTGLSYDTDDSEVVTRLYPISDDDIRYNSFDTGTSGNNSYYDAENWREYPFIRAAFVDVPYSLIDTDISDENPYKTDTTDLTEEIYNTVYNDGEAAIQAFWADVCTENVFEYTHESETSVIYLIPEFVQDVIKVISTTVADNVLNDAGVIHEGLRSWLTKAIRASMEWVEDVDLPMKGWIQNQDNSYSYGTELRKLTNEWGYIDRKMSWFGNDTKWVEKKDDKFDWDWIQKKGQRAKYGNDKRYLARATYIYNRNDYEGGANDDFYKYWFDADGYYDGEEETTTWDWRGSGTVSDPYWFGESDPAGDTSKYAHDCWLFIRTSSDSARKLYHFNSDGYLDDEEVVGWDWLKDGEKWYFGSTNKNNRTTNLVSQWMKIDGDYYYFDSNGYVVDLKDTMMGLAEVLSIYLSDVLIDAIQGGQNDLYNCLYAHMKDYCDDLYDNGLCDPTINVSIDFVDLSMTEEYKDFSDLEKVCLGDRVKVVYNLYGNTQYSIEEYVKGLTYDCIRGYNTKIEVGGVSSVTSLFDTSVKGTGNEQRLVAGENVTINGNVINVSANTGDVYAGDKVTVTQLQTTGQPIARISVNGMPTTIYAVGSDVEVEPIKQSGDHIATITVGGVDYNIYADTGLKYWVETEEDIYRTGQRAGLSCDTGYKYTSAFWNTKDDNTNPYTEYNFRKVNNEPVIGVSYAEGYYWMILSTISAQAVEWEFQQWTGSEYGEWKEPVDSTNYGLYTPCIQRRTFTYLDATWYLSWGYGGNVRRTTPFSVEPYNIQDASSLVTQAKKIIDYVHGKPYIVDVMGISNQDHVFYYCPEWNGTHDDTKDTVYITKDGIINAAGFSVDGSAVGAFYKTNLYLGNSYSATVGLSDSYTKYDMLLIETYNQDDKKNLASMVNVSDLTNASYVGVDGYLMYTITNGRTLTFHEAPSDTNHSRYIKAVYGLRTSHEGGTESPITDVVVDGESCVAGGVAVINGKQDAFGDVNIVNPTNGQVLTYDATNDEWKNANGGGGASAINDLTDVNVTNPANEQVLKYNSTSQKWENSNGGGGSTVSITPILSSGTKIAEFEIDGVSGDLFAPNGGGGGSEYDEEILYSGVNSQSSYTLSNNISDYDLIGIRCARSSNFEVYNIFPASYLLDSITTQKKVGLATDDKYTFFKVTNETTLTKQEENDLHIVGVIGIVTGGSGGGGASAINDLTDVDITSPANGQVLKYNSTLQKWENANESGGTTVIANPSGTATDTLTKIQVDNTIYEIEGGGGGGIDYSQKANWDTFNETITKTATIHAGESLRNYVDIDKDYSKTGREMLCQGITVYGTDSNSNTYLLEAVVESSIDLGTMLRVNYKVTNNESVDIVSLILSPTFQSPKSGTSGGGGGGGNTITYGTDVPTSSANDGDLYFLLSGGMKKAEFLYMSNAWSLIDGTLDVIEDVVLTQSRRNSSTADTYTATEECTVLCVNQNMNGEASTKSLTSSIVTTGTILYTDEYSVGWSNPERNQCTRVSLVHLEEGDTVTLSNSYEGNYITQLHVVIKITNYTTLNQITRKASTARADNSYGASETYSLGTAGLYFAIGFQTRGTGGGTTYATISTSNDSETYELIRAGANESISIAMVKHPNTITFAWNNQSDYATKGYAVYKLS